MGNYLIRTVKCAHTGTMPPINSNLFTYIPVAQGFYKEFHSNEYVVDLDELDGVEIAYIVDRIVEAERMLMVNQIHLFVSIFDLAQYVRIEPQSDAIMLFPTSSSDSANTDGINNHKFSSWGWHSYYDENGFVAQYQELELQNNPASTYYPTNRFAGNLSFKERCLTVARQRETGAPLKFSYFGCVTDNDVSISTSGTIAANRYSELLCTRLNMYNYYMRFVLPYIASNSVNEDGVLQPMGFSYGITQFAHISDRKSAKRVWDNKSEYARKSIGTIVSFIMDYHKYIWELNELNDSWGYNLDVSLPFFGPIKSLRSSIMRLLKFLIESFPYLINDMEIDKELANTVVYDPYKFLIPEFKYEFLIEIFTKILSYYTYLTYWCDLYDKYTIRSPYVANQMTTSVTSYSNLTRHSWPKNIPMAPEHRAAWVTIGNEYYNIVKTCDQFHYLLCHLERYWDVRSYYGILNKPPGKRQLYTRLPGHFATSNRTPGESGRSYKKIRHVDPGNARERESAKHSYSDVTPMAPDAYNKNVWYWGAVDWNFRPLTPDNHIYVGGPGYVPPVPPSDKTKKKGKFVWRNVIDPLDPEQEDEEAIAMLEEVEENLRFVGHTIHSTTKLILKERGINYPPIVDVAIYMTWDRIVEGINPTDRPKLKLPKIPIDLAEGGDIAKKFDGWKRGRNGTEN